MVVIRTGTDNYPVAISEEEDTPNVIRTRRERTIKAYEESGVDALDIPAFLRKQAD
jgi:cell division protein FtsZ